MSQSVGPLSGGPKPIQEPIKKLRRLKEKLEEMANKVGKSASGAVSSLVGGAKEVIATAKEKILAMPSFQSQKAGKGSPKPSVSSPKLKTDPNLKIDPRLSGVLAPLREVFKEINGLQYLSKPRPGLNVTDHMGSDELMVAVFWRKGGERTPEETARMNDAIERLRKGQV